MVPLSIVVPHRLCGEFQPSPLRRVPAFLGRSFSSTPANSYCAVAVAIAVVVAVAVAVAIAVAIAVAVAVVVAVAAAVSAAVSVAVSAAVAVAVGVAVAVAVAVAIAVAVAYRFKHHNPQSSATGTQKISAPSGISTPCGIGFMVTLVFLGFAMTPSNPIDSHRNTHTARDSLIRPSLRVTSPANTQPRSTTITARVPVATG
ncbi:MAG: hypothetical protein EBS68_15565 [Rhodobacteraceae bacterium]|nr:hypothetical protein [Paracoccaceae bacterium]